MRLTLLQRSLRRLERPPGCGAEAVVGLGDRSLDAALPWRGLPRVGLHDVVAAVADAAADGFALALAGRLAGGSGRVLLVQPRRREACGRLYGPGLVRLGLDPDRLILATARRPAELLWTMEEGLRCGALAVVVGEGARADLTAFRRLQLAAEKGRAAALLLAEPGETRSSAALTRWRISAALVPGDARGLRWRVILERCRGGRPGDWLVDWDDETHRFLVVPPLGDRRLALATA
jgi:protein ImuA